MNELANGHSKEPRDFQLSPMDYQVIVSALPQLYQLRDLAALPPVMLQFLSSLIPNSISTYGELIFSSRTFVMVCHPPHLREWLRQFMPAVNRYMHQSPLWQHLEKFGPDGVRLISDFLGEDEWHRTEFYQEGCVGAGIEDTLSIPLQYSAAALSYITLNRPQRDFTERDRKVAEMVRPHLIAAYENAVAFTESQALALLSTRTIDKSSHGIALVDVNAHVLHINSAALHLLERHFEQIRADGWRVSLPEAVITWLGNQGGLNTRSAFERINKSRKLRLRAADAGEGRLLVLFQETSAIPNTGPLRALGLSPREADVLWWMSEGKSNADVAAVLHISRRTVEKHIETIYAKLGVETRTAALLKAVEQLKH